MSAREVTVVRKATGATLAVSTGITDNGGSSSEMFVVGLEDKVDGNFSAKPTLSKDLPKLESRTLLRKLLRNVFLLSEKWKNRERQFVKEVGICVGE